MRRSIMFLICAVGLVLSLACGGTSGTVVGADTEPVPQSTGDRHIVNGDGCPEDEGYTYVQGGTSYGGCRFESGNITLRVYCSGEYNRNFLRGQAGPVWRSDDEPSRRGLQVFWPGGDGPDGTGFACVKERCFDCE